MSSPLRVALVGCGRFAISTHIPALRRLEKDGRIKIVAICSRSEESIARASRKLGRQDVKKYRQLQELLADPGIDLVDLVLPISAMPDAIRASLQAGKHVVSEKPCAPSVAKGLDLLDFHASLENQPLWAVAENWRFKPSIDAIQRIVASGAIGAINFADFKYMTFNAPTGLGWRGAPEYAGGNLLDSGVHFIAMLRELAGEITSVTATVSQRVAHLPPADSVTAVVSFAGGAEGSFRLSFSAPRTDISPGLTLVGSEGSIFANFQPSIIDIRGKAGKQQIGFRNDRWVQGGVYELLAHCVDVIELGISLRCTAWEALRDVAVLEAMLESSRLDMPVSPSSFYPSLHGGNQRVDTYDRIWSFRPRHVVECASIAAVRSAISEAVAAGLRVRTIGNGFSWAPHVLTKDVGIRLSGLKKIHSIDTARKTVVVDAGARLGDLTRALAAKGLSLPSLSILADATIGGAVATATHGTSPRWGTFSDSVISMKLVLASGEVKTLGPNSLPEELRAARVAVGMLGVIVELELQAIDMPWVRFSEMTMNLTEFLARRASILAQYEHVWVHWTLGTDEVLVKYFETRPQPEAGFRPYVIDDEAPWRRDTVRTQFIKNAKNALRPVYAKLKSLAPRAATQEAESQVRMSLQYGVPAPMFESAVERIRASEIPKQHSGQIVELKYLAGSDQSFLGPNAEGDAVLFNLFWTVDEDVKYTVFDAFETLMRSLDAKPHWGKFHQTPNHDYMRRAYPHWAEFEAVREKLDPAGTFSIFPEEPTVKAGLFRTETGA